MTESRSPELAAVRWSQKARKTKDKLESRPKICKSWDRLGRTCQKQLVIDDCGRVVLSDVCEVRGRNKGLRVRKGTPIKLI